MNGFLECFTYQGCRALEGIVIGLATVPTKIIKSLKLLKLLLWTNRYIPRIRKEKAKVSRMVTSDNLILCIVMLVLGYIYSWCKDSQFLGKQSLIGYVAFALWCVVSLLSLEQCLPGNVACGLHLLDQVGSLNTNYTPEKLGMVINPNTMALHGTCAFFVFVFLEDEAWKTLKKTPEKFNSCSSISKGLGNPKRNGSLFQVSTLQAIGALDPAECHAFNRCFHPRTLVTLQLAGI